VPEAFIVNNEYLLTSSLILSVSNNNFSSYLVGLIEGDGSIIVPTENIKSYKPYLPSRLRREGLRSLSIKMI